MGDIVEFFSRPIAQFPEYPWWLYVITLVVITAATEGLKFPIKNLTDRIQDEVKRKRVNTVIMIIPIALAFAADGLFTAFGYSFSVTVGFAWGGASQVLYGVISRLFKRKENGETITEEKIVEDFNDSVKEAKTADETFDELIKNYKKKS